MRWMWIDRMVEFVRATRAVAIKNVSIVEEPIDEYNPAYPCLPHTLVIEGLAQTAGLLVGEVNDFRDRVVLAKIVKAEFHRMAVPGDQLVYRADVEDIRDNGAIVRCESTIGGEPHANVEMVFAYLDDRFPEDLFHPYEMYQMVRAFGIYDVAVDVKGERIPAPAFMVEAERAAYGEG